MSVLRVARRVVLLEWGLMLLSLACYIVELGSLTGTFQVRCDERRDR
jgi:hypothetical protein